MITADLPPDQFTEQNVKKTNDEDDIDKKLNKNYDIRLKKLVLKNKKEIPEDISLEINSFGKYCLTKTVKF